MYFIDTNVFLEWFLARKNAKDCEVLFEKIIKDKIFCVCSRFSIYSVLIYLTGNKKIKEATKFLEFMASVQEIQVSSLSLSDDLEVIKIMHETDLDFDDALQYHSAVQLECNAVITFDKDFRKTKIKTLTPAEALKELSE